MEEVAGHVWVKVSDEWACCWECRRWIRLPMQGLEPVEWAKGAQMLRAAKSLDQDAAGRRGPRRARRGRRG